MRGHEYDVANVCAECKGPLRDAAGSFHERLIEGVGYAAQGHAGVEPICSQCRIKGGVIGRKPTGMLLV